MLSHANYDFGGSDQRNTLWMRKGQAAFSTPGSVTLWYGNFVETAETIYVGFNGCGLGHPLRSAHTLRTGDNELTGHDDQGRRSMMKLVSEAVFNPAAGPWVVTTV